MIKYRFIDEDTFREATLKKRAIEADVTAYRLETEAARVKRIADQLSLNIGNQAELESKATLARTKANSIITRAGISEEELQKARLEFLHRWMQKMEQEHIRKTVDTELGEDGAPSEVQIIEESYKLAENRSDTVENEYRRLVRIRQTREDRGR